MTDPIIDRLDQIKGRADKATEGPWTPIWEEGDDWWMIYGAPHYDGVHYRLCPEVAIVEGDSSWSDDARFISAARTDVEQLGQALRAVLDLHHLDTDDVACGNPRHTNADVGRPECYHPCQHCYEPYPCPTYQAIVSALGVETEGGEK